jgi:hypothetical protein
MTPDDFRRIALSFPGSMELNGLGYPNFRAGRKSFATIEDSMGVIRLTRDQQAEFVAAAPEMFAPVSSGWGRLGSTVVRFEVADKATVQDALAAAWRNVADVVNVAAVLNVAEVDDVVHIAEVTEVAEVVNLAEVVNVADVAEVADVEPRDHLKTLIERLRVSWEPGPARRIEPLRSR